MCPAGGGMTRLCRSIERADRGMSVRRDGHKIAVTVPSRSKTEAEVTAQTDHMSDLKEAKAALRHYLQSNRDALLWKLDGLGERDLRTPRTPARTSSASSSTWPTSRSATSPTPSAVNGRCPTSGSRTRISRPTGRPTGTRPRAKPATESSTSTGEWDL